MSHWKRSALIATLALNAVGIANAFPLKPPTPRVQPVATAPGQNALLCFDGASEGSGYGGACTPNPGGVDGAALLETADGDVDGSHAGVYTNDSTMYGRRLSDVERLSFRYGGSAATARSPRFALPLDRNGDGSFNHWVFVAANGCNDGAGLVDVVNDRTCAIQVDGGAGYENWAALVAAFPHARVAPNQYVLGLAFVVADEPGKWTIDYVEFGRPVEWRRSRALRPRPASGPANPVPELLLSTGGSGGGAT